MSADRRYDVAVLGGGPGGYAVAFRAAAHGLDVALVEQDRIGGTCLHRGCVPSKAVLHVAEVLGEVHRADTLGLKLTYDGLDGDALAAFRQGVIDDMDTGLRSLVHARTTVHTGRGRLVTDDDGSVGIEVAGPDGVERVTARHVVLATGSVPRTLPDVAVDGEVVQTSDEAIWFTEPPERAVIVGAGAIGMEFASMWSPMGTQVTVVEALDRVLPLEDADSSAAVTRAFARRGIRVLSSTSVRGVRVDGDRASVDVEVAGEPETLDADRVLVAVGRGPATADTGAKELGVLDERGFVVTDDHGATTVDGLWAVGDVRPTLALAHAAFAEGAVVADRIAGLSTRPVDHVHTPRVTYCHPEVASVGLTEAQARERFGDDVVTATASFRANAKGLMAGTSGMVKVVHHRGPAPAGAPEPSTAPAIAAAAEAARAAAEGAEGSGGVSGAGRTGAAGETGASGPVLGVHVVGPHATDLIGEATLATAWEAVPAELAAISHAHPTLYEAIGEAFQAAAGVPFHGR